MTFQHIILKLKNVPLDNVLKNAEALTIKMDYLLECLNMTVVGKISHQFQPYGATSLHLLSESHASAHTFWEEKEIYLDLFSCKDFNELNALVKIKEMFETKDVEFLCLNR